MTRTALSLKEARVCIVGLGLMGGSLALALRGQVARLSAVDADPATRSRALAGQIASPASDSLTLAAEADVVVLATPVGSIIELIAELPAILAPGALLMDLGSVKGPVVAAMNTLPASIDAVGGHPMCGKSVAGLEHAEADLYRDALFVLCRTGRTSPHAMRLATELAGAVGARPVEMDAAHHDRVAAVVSGLPYALSASLALTAGVRAQYDPAVWELASTGFRDTSRLAGTDPALMADILLTNAPAVLDAIGEAQRHLAGLADAVRAGDPRHLSAFLSHAQAARHAWEKETHLR